MANANRTKCPKCGYAGVHPSMKVCPKCSASLKRRSLPVPGFFKKKWVMIPLLLFLIAASGLAVLFFSNESVATELRQIREPRPNEFFLAIDVSATISSDTLEKLKSAAIERLRNFIGDDAVSYSVYTFGNPGCGGQSFRKVLSTQSPEDEVTFTWKVEEKIEAIEITQVETRRAVPLTTPLFNFLETYLPERKGSRVIVFSDLLNDDSDCARQYIFPEEALLEFGKNTSSQIVFLYPSPDVTDNPEMNQRKERQQQEFIGKVKLMTGEGKLRTLFYHIPDDPLKRAQFLRGRLKEAIPATAFDLVQERVRRVVYTVVTAVRG